MSYMTATEAQSLDNEEQAKPDSPWKIAGMTALFGVFALGYYSVKNFRKGHSATGVTCLVLAAVIVCAIALAFAPRDTGSNTGLTVTPTVTADSDTTAEGFDASIPPASESAAWLREVVTNEMDDTYGATVTVTDSICNNTDHGSSKCAVIYQDETGDNRATFVVHYSSGVPTYEFVDDGPVNADTGESE